MEFPEQIYKAAEKHKYPLVFATVSGAHLYGFPSPDSDFDLRGVHVLPLTEVVGLEDGEDTIEIAEDRDGIELDLVTHDVKKFFKLMLKKNGYVLEQLYSPLIIRTNSSHDELKEIAKTCITRHHAYHYEGFAKNQWKLFSKEIPHRIKPLLYTYRVVLTGIHLMRSGVIEANLNILNEEFQLPYLTELIAEKVNSKEKKTNKTLDIVFHESEILKLLDQLKEASEKSSLPEEPSARPALNDLLKRLRLNT